MEFVSISLSSIPYIYYNNTISFHYKYDDDNQFAFHTLIFHVKNTLKNTTDHRKFNNNNLITIENNNNNNRIKKQKIRRQHLANTKC